MDIIYAEMCSKATEIQSAWHPSFGDLTNQGIVVRIFPNGEKGVVSPGGDGVYSRDLLIWYPYQDQLQEMILDKRDALTLYCNTHDIICFDWKYFESFKTMEQLWFALVMRERYKKIWIEEDWK